MLKRCFTRYLAAAVHFSPGLKNSKVLLLGKRGRFRCRYNVAGGSLAAGDNHCFSMIGHIYYVTLY